MTVTPKEELSCTFLGSGWVSFMTGSGIHVIRMKLNVSGVPDHPDKMLDTVAYAYAVWPQPIYLDAPEECERGTPSNWSQLNG
jgi:hypothetical protein